MVSTQRWRPSDRPEIRSRHRDAHRPRLELLENRTLLSTACDVDHLADDLIGSGGTAGSLRYCMSFTPHVDEITFVQAPAGDINLVGALPLINWDVDIVGRIDQLTELPAVTVRRDTGGNYRIFEIASGKTVTIQDLTIANGISALGGGILNNGNLTISNSIITGNVATPLDGEQVVFGGGIANLGTLTVTAASRISNNRVKGTALCVTSPGIPPEEEMGGGMDGLGGVAHLSRYLRRRRHFRRNFIRHHGQRRNLH